MRVANGADKKNRKGKKTQCFGFEKGRIMRRKCRDCGGRGIWHQYTSVYHIKMTHTCNRCGGIGLEKLSYKEVRLKDGQVSLVKLAEKKIKDIKGYIVVNQFDEFAFQMKEIVFEDNSLLHCDGEHKVAYTRNWGSHRYHQPNLENWALYDIWADGHDNPYQHREYKTIIREKKGEDKR